MFAASAVSWMSLPSLSPSFDPGSCLCFVRPGVFGFRIIFSRSSRPLVRSLLPFAAAAAAVTIPAPEHANDDDDDDDDNNDGVPDVKKSRTRRASRTCRP